LAGVMKNLRGFTFFTAGGKKNGTSAVRTYILYNTKPYNTALYVLYIEPGAANNWDYWMRACALLLHCCCAACAPRAGTCACTCTYICTCTAWSWCPVRSAQCAVCGGVRSAQPPCITWHHARCTKGSTSTRQYMPLSKMQKLKPASWGAWLVAVWVCGDGVACVVCRLASGVWGLGSAGCSWLLVRQATDATSPKDSGGATCHSGPQLAAAALLLPLSTELPLPLVLVQHCALLVRGECHVVCDVPDPDPRSQIPAIDPRTARQPQTPDLPLARGTPLSPVVENGPVGRPSPRSTDGVPVTLVAAVL
jgi:hypothetical protein